MENNEWLPKPFFEENIRGIANVGRTRRGTGSKKWEF
jgi:hypothetical protein